MNARPGENPQGWRDAVLVLIAAAILFGWRLGMEPPEQTAEARVPVAARNMVREGFTAIPQLGGEPWLKKPPLAVWLQALSMEIFGENLAAAGFPGAVLAALLAAAVARYGGLLAGLILLLSPRFLISARGAEMDITFAALTGLAILRGLEEIRRHRRAGWASQLLLGLALIVKGPLCLVFALLAWGRGWLTPWAPLALLPGAAWLGWAWRQDPQIVPTLWNEIFIRFGKEREIHTAPFYDHAANLFPLAAPAILPLALLAAVCAVWVVRRWRGTLPEARPGTDPPSISPVPLLPLLFWFLGGLLLLSLLPQKQTSYVLPLYPALALIAARAAMVPGVAGPLLRVSRVLGLALPAAAAMSWIAGARWEAAAGAAAGLLGGAWTWKARRGTAAYARLLLAAIPVFLLGVLPWVAADKERLSLVPVGERFRHWAEERLGRPEGAIPLVVLKPKWEELTWGFGEDLRAVDSIEEARSLSAAAAVREVEEGEEPEGGDLPVLLEQPHPRHPRRRIQIINLRAPAAETDAEPRRQAAEGAGNESARPPGTP